MLFAPTWMLTLLIGVVACSGVHRITLSLIARTPAVGNLSRWHKRPYYLSITLSLQGPSILIKLEGKVVFAIFRWRISG